MSEILTSFIGPALGCFSGGIITYVILKRTISDDNIIKKIDMILDEYTSNEEALRKIYTLGGILGKGLRDGVGIDRMMPKKKGGIEGFLMELAGNWIGKRLGIHEQTEPQPEHALDRTW